MPTTTDRYLIAIGTKIEPRIYRTQAEAESAAGTLAFHSRRETATYRLSDAALVSVWREQRLGIPMGEYADFHLVVVPSDGAFRPDGSSWLDKPAETARKPLPETATF